MMGSKKPLLLKDLVGLCYLGGRGAFLPFPKDGQTDGEDVGHLLRLRIVIGHFEWFSNLYHEAPLTTTLHIVSKHYW